MLWMVAILTAKTRSVLDAAFGTDAVGELSPARQITSYLRPGMVLLENRNFATHGFFRTGTATGADFCVRAKTGATAMHLPVLDRLADGSSLSTAGGERVRVLRGRHPGAVFQQSWALLTCYQVLRAAMTEATLQHPGIDPDRLSSTIALHTAHDQVVQARGTFTGAATNLVGAIGAALLAEPMPARRIRTRPHVVKRAISMFRAKARNIKHQTHPATLTTKILSPNHSP
ncbi:hypothetical protein [Kocuria marina]|uniref:hypothetical protein n=1 Tax=Kocuria marina TaxID=223184 RepID=UPI0022E929EA|nr:hypothetical protein [Kocuria marina]